MDFAIDFVSGDLILAANRDFAGISGPDEIVQRIHVRLLVERGAWLDDPSDGQLGSRLRGLSGMNANRVAGELPILIREALEPMDDIVVQDVIVTQDPDDESLISAEIVYRDISDPDESEIDTTSSVTIPLART